MGRSTRAEKVTVAYLDECNGFVSNHNALNFMKNLSKSVHVKTLRFDFSKLDRKSPDHLLSAFDAYFREVIVPSNVDFIYTNNMALYPLLLYYRHLYGREVNFILFPHSVLPNSILVWLLVAPLVRGSDCVIVQSDTAKRELGKISEAFQRPVPLPHCIDKKQFTLDEQIIRDRFAKRRLVYVGRIQPKKNIITLVEAM